MDEMWPAHCRRTVPFEPGTCATMARRSVSSDWYECSTLPPAAGVGGPDGGGCRFGGNTGRVRPAAPEHAAVAPPET